MNDSLQKELTIVTPEQVQLQFQTAGIGSRAIAHMIDALLLLIFNSVIVLFLILGGDYVWNNSPVDSEGYLLAITIIVVIILNVGYFISTEAYMGGQTLGKRWIGLRVLQDNGQSATLLSILIRNLFRLLDLLPMAYFLGAVVMMFSSRDKRLGDMVAGTIVVLEIQRERLKRRKRIEKTISVWRSHLPQLELEEYRKRSITSQDWLLLQTWIERLPNVSKAKLFELSQPIAGHIAVKLEHPAELTADPAAYLLAVYLELQADWDY